jgi:hypothetical protein
VNRFPVDLRQQDHVAAAVDAGVQCDPAGVPPHHLEHHDPLVAGGGGVEPVERVGGARDRGIEAEREGGGTQVVVDRLRHAHHRQAVLEQLLGDGERPVAADADEPADGELTDRRRRLVEQAAVDG